MTFSKNDKAAALMAILCTQILGKLNDKNVLKRVQIYCRK
jgi:hypothetical protein